MPEIIPLIIFSIDSYSRVQFSSSISSRNLLQNLNTYLKKIIQRACPMLKLLDKTIFLSLLRGCSRLTKLNSYFCIKMDLCSSIQHAFRLISVIFSWLDLNKKSIACSHPTSFMLGFSEKSKISSWLFCSSIIVCLIP